MLLSPLAFLQELLLASVLLHREYEPNDGQCERDYVQLPPVPGGHRTEAPPRLFFGSWLCFWSGFFMSTDPLLDFSFPSPEKVP